MSDGQRAPSPIDDPQGNEQTAAEIDASSRVSHGDFATLFDMNYEEIRREHAAVSGAGILGLAFDLGSSQLAAKRTARARPGVIDAVTLGRHNRCDLSLPRDRSISLRHLVLVVHPFAPGNTRILFRVLDLHTQLGFQDCFGNRMQAVEADGPAMIAVGRYALLLLPTGNFRLPDTARKAWDIVADPLYLEYRTEYMLKTWDPAPSGTEPDVAVKRDALRPASSLRLDDARDEQLRTSFTLLDGPARPTSKALRRTDQLLGVLEVEAAHEVQMLSIDAALAEHGLLIGSYDRRDDSCMTHLNHPAISRVHLLLLSCEGELFAVDTASSNGTFVETSDGRRVRARVIKLAPGIALSLADSRALLRWTAVC